MISNELLSEVLKIEVLHFSINIDHIYVEEKNKHININIYELAHKCKEWAYDNGYMMRIENHYKNSIKIEIRKPVANSKYLEYWKTTFKTEYEAIFRVCDWILQNKEMI